MRKITLIVSIIALFAMLSGALLFAEEGVLKIATLTGKVLVKTQGSKDWVEAKMGQWLNKNDSIKTLEDGIAYLEFVANKGFTLRPNSELIIEDALTAPPVAEPYSEPAIERDAAANVVAPEVNQDSAASKI